MMSSFGSNKVGEYLSFNLSCRFLNTIVTSAKSMLSTPVDRALAAGLSIRPFAETVAATLEWIATGDDAPSDPRPAGLAREKEQRVLEAWADRSRLR